MTRKGMRTGARMRMSPEARKQEIVRAALETIAEHGVQGATISRIAKGAGITPAALYSHFENRQAILLAALDVVYEQVFDSFRSSSSGDAVERVREIFEHHAEKVRNQDPTSHAHLFLEFVASAPEEGLREALREKELATASYLASIVGELQHQGRLGKEVDPDLIAWLIAGWAWTGDVASSMGVTSTWYERVSPRLIEFILATLSGTWPRATGGPARATGGAAGRGAAPGGGPAADGAVGGPMGNGAVGAATPILREAIADGLPDGAVFTVDEAAVILKVPRCVVEQMALEREIRSVRLGGETRIPRRALLACLRGMSADEFDGYLEERSSR
jgi:excisionase family DNA binding protein